MIKDLPKVIEDVFLRSPVKMEIALKSILTGDEKEKYESRC